MKGIPDPKTCGDLGGTTAAGDPCTRALGWGFPEPQESRCIDHHEATLSKGDREGLTDRQARFVQVYCGEARFNATQAARLAGYSGKRQTVAVMGHKLLQTPKVRDAIRKLLDEQAMTSEEALRRLTDWARGDISHFLRAREGEDGEPGEVYLDLTSEEARQHLHLIRELTISDEGEVKIKLESARQATETIAKIRGLFKDERDVSFYVFLDQASDDEIIRMMRERMDRLGKIFRPVDSLTPRRPEALPNGRNGSA